MSALPCRVVYITQITLPPPPSPSPLWRVSLLPSTSLSLSLSPPPLSPPPPPPPPRVPARLSEASLTALFAALDAERSRAFQSLKVRLAGLTGATLWGRLIVSLWGRLIAPLWGHHIAPLLGRLTAPLWGNHIAPLLGRLTAPLWGLTVATLFETAAAPPPHYPPHAPHHLPWPRPPSPPAPPPITPPPPAHIRSAWRPTQNSTTRFSRRCRPLPRRWSTTRGTSCSDRCWCTGGSCSTCWAPSPTPCRRCAQGLARLEVRRRPCVGSHPGIPTLYLCRSGPAGA